MRELLRWFRFRPASDSHRGRPGRAHLVALLIILGGVVTLGGIGYGIAAAAAGSAPPATLTTVPTVPVAASLASSAISEIRTSDADSGPETASSAALGSTIVERLATPRAQGLGQYAADALSAAGFKGFLVAEAVEMTLPDTTVTDILLAQKGASAKGSVLVTIFKNPDNSPILATTSEADTSGDDDIGTSIGYRHEAISLADGTEACLITGPFGSYLQLLVQLPDQTVINILSDTGQLKGGKLPLDRDGLEKLLGLLLKRVS